jgi:Acyl-CoA reductase (LuxC)
MVTAQDRLALLQRLKAYLIAAPEDWQETKMHAAQQNAWFTREHIDYAVNNIISEFLDADKLADWIGKYSLPEVPKLVGIVMAGNIPLVGFHDFLCGFLSGNRIMLKLSSKDSVLLTKIIGVLIDWQPELAQQINIADRLNNCDAYIATGSNNSSRYFEQYFGHVPHLIRKNRTSVALLTGNETDSELELLCEDVFSYFGLGCRNVTQVCVPVGYDFANLLRVFGKKEDLRNFHKYNNNYDYHLALYLLNRVPYITNGSLLMVENDLPFSAVSVLHYRYYNDSDTNATNNYPTYAVLEQHLRTSADIQAIVGAGHLQFGTTQRPRLQDYADGADTMEFLCNI